MKCRRITCQFGMILCAIVLSPGLSAQAQTPSSTPSPTPEASKTPTLESQFFRNVLRDQEAIWTSPFRLHGRDARWLAPLGLGTAALIATDRRTGDEIAKFDDQLQMSRIVSHVGSTYGVGSIAAAFYFIGRKRGDARARETGLPSAEALIDSEIVVTALKEITLRARPSSGAERSEFFKGGTSFPSGHGIQAWYPRGPPLSFLSR